MLCLGIALAACEPQAQPSESPVADSTPTEAPAPAPQLNSYLAIFEIPATDIARAITFYETVLELPIEKMDMPGMAMGILPYENQAVSGVIIQGEGYEPSAGGVTIYLNAGDDLQSTLDRVEPAGGQVLVPKTAHADESGYFALFMDSEGNRLGLNSPN